MAMTIADRIRSAAIAGSAMLAAAAQAFEMSRRMAEVARLAGVLTDRAEAERLHAMVYRVAIEEALSTPHVLATTRIRQYLDALHDRAARGESLPETDDDLRRMPEAVEWRITDLARAMGVAVE